MLVEAGERDVKQPESVSIAPQPLRGARLRTGVRSQRIRPLGAIGCARDHKAESCHSGGSKHTHAHTHVHTEHEQSHDEHTHSHTHTPTAYTGDF